MPALRIVRPPPAAPEPRGQRCFSWMPIIIVVHPYRRVRKRVVCKSPGPVAAKAPAPRQLPLTVRPLVKPAIRTVDLRPYAERRIRSGVKPKLLVAVRLGAGEREQMDIDIAELEAAGMYALRPRRGNGIDGDCQPGPCAWISCRHHNKYDVDPDTGEIRDNFPNLDWDEMDDTCSLRVAAQVNESGETLPLMAVGGHLNITEGRTEQIQYGALAKVKAALKLEETRAALKREEMQSKLGAPSRFGRRRESDGHYSES